MSDSSKNRVASSKTTRGSQYPHRNAKYICIVQRSQHKTQSPITVVEVSRILSVGKLLFTVLTQEERADLSRLIRNGNRREPLAPCLDTGEPGD